MNTTVFLLLLGVFLVLVTTAFIALISARVSKKVKIFVKFGMIAVAVGAFVVSVLTAQVPSENLGFGIALFGLPFLVLSVVLFLIPTERKTPETQPTQPSGPLRPWQKRLDVTMRIVFAALIVGLIVRAIWWWLSSPLP